MKISFTNKEFLTLLEMTNLASWILDYHCPESLSAKKPYQDMEEKLLGLAKEFGYGDLVQYDQKLKAHVATRDFEDRIMGFINEYDDENLWTELMNRLVYRDMVRAMGEKQYLALPLEERIAKELPYEQKYQAEFTEHGVERLQIVGSPLAGGHN